MRRARLDHPVDHPGDGRHEGIHPASPGDHAHCESSTENVLTSTLTIAAPQVTASAPATRYVVQPGDTLSGIAARFAVRGGWPALYTLNLRALGRDPNAIRPGTVLTVPGRAPVRYTVAAGDTLSGIAAGLGVPGGWPALYAANRRAIGRDPDSIRPGTVLTVPHPAAAPPAPGQGHPRHPAPAPTPPVCPRTMPSRDQRSSGGPGHAAVAEDHAAGRGPADPGGFSGRAGTGGPPPPAAAAGAPRRLRRPRRPERPGRLRPVAGHRFRPGGRLCPRPRAAPSGSPARSRAASCSPTTIGSS